MEKARFEPFLNLPKPAQWFILVALSVILGGFLEMAQLPAALLLGPMIAAILMEVGGGKIRIPSLPFHFAQSVIGCMVAHAISSDIIGSFLHQWPLFLSVMMTIILASSLLGFVISKLKILPDTTAVWGTLPGIASVMMVLAEEFGADGRLVAFMQYLRVILVALAASLIARFWGHIPLGVATTIWFPEIHWTAFAETLGLVLLGIVLGKRSHIPAGTILLPLVIGSALHMEGAIQIELPFWFLALSYLILGWNIGLRFTHKILVHALRVLPQILLSIIILMSFCGLLAYLLVVLLDIDPLTAYLATSPGGVDSVAIIAASTKVDMPFVMAMQTTRLLLILLIGPPLSRWIARKVTFGKDP